MEILYKHLRIDTCRTTAVRDRETALEEDGAKNVVVEGGNRYCEKDEKMHRMHEKRPGEVK